MNSSSAPKGDETFFVRHIQWKFHDPMGNYVRNELSEIVAWLDTKKEAEAEVKRLRVMFPYEYRTLNLLSGSYQVWQNNFFIDTVKKT